MESYFEELLDSKKKKIMTKQQLKSYSKYVVIFYRFDIGLSLRSGSYFNV